MDFITDSYQVFPMAWMPKKEENIIISICVFPLAVERATITVAIQI
jgi:hypothetical protein